MNLKCNWCDGIYNSFDIHFTSACDNKCRHCIDCSYEGLGIKKPDVKAIVKTVVENQEGFDDVLFLGGEPCLYLDELYYCAKQIKENTNLKVFVTTAVPKACSDNRDLFVKLLELVDGLNLSAQHYREDVADDIRNTESKYNRQKFYNSLPFKDKIRINLNIVKPFLYKKDDIVKCLKHYDKMGFNSIKLSEIQHGKEHYASFEKVFDVDYGSAYSNGCQKYINTEEIVPGMKTPLLLKRSCFICEETLNATFMDGLKVLTKAFVKGSNKYGVIYENGLLQKGWI
jgi:organic radical activating enzyme